MIKFKKWLIVSVGVVSLLFFLSAKQSFAETFGDYTYSQNGLSATITSYNGSGGDITIPDSLDSYAVSDIATNAFQNKKLTSVIIPDTVTNIGDSAFADNNYLAYIYFPGLSGAPTLGTDVFLRAPSYFKVYYDSGKLGFDPLAWPYATVWSRGLCDNVCTDKGLITDGDVYGSNSGLSNITGALGVLGALPTAINFSSVSWYSDTPLIISNDGQTVVRPASGDQDANVSMYAVITDGLSITETKRFDLVVKAEEGLCDNVCLDKAALTNSVILGSNSDVSNITGPLGSLPVVGSNGSTISWSSSNASVISNDGQTVVRPAYGDPDANVTLTATITDGLLVTDTKQFSLVVKAEAEEETGAADFTYTDDGVNATITSYTGAGGDVVIPNSLGGFPVTSIGDWSMSNKSLTSIVIPNSVASIGQNAFSNNPNLSSVTIGNGVTLISYSAFSNNPGLTSIVIPNSVTSIGSYAFSNNPNLSSVTIGTGVTNIGVSAFSSNNLLTSLNIPASVSSITFPLIDNSGVESINVDPSNLTYASEDGVLFDKSKMILYEYPEMKNVNSYVVPSGVTIINQSAFSYSRSLSSVTLPDGLVNIGNYAFSYSGVTELSIPSSVTTIDAYAFSDASLTAINVDANNSHYSSEDGILFNKNKTTFVRYPQAKTGTSYIVPSTVIRINARAFQGNNILSSLVVPDTVTLINAYAFAYMTHLVNLTLSNSITTIETGLLQNSGIVSIIIPNTVTTIGSNAFMNTELTSIIIPNTVTTISSNAFNGTELTSIIIPSSVTSIGEYSFSWNQYLASVYFMGNAPQMGSNVFNQAGSSFKVYYGAGSTGFTNPWNTYTTEVSSDITNMKADRDALTSSSIKGANADLSNIYSPLVLSTSGENGSTISWSSNSSSIISNDGQTIIRPAYASEDATVVMTATITSGSFSDTKSFTLIVKKLESDQIQATSAVTIDTTQKEVVVNSQSGTTITVPPSVTDAKVNVSALTTDNSIITTATLPAITLNTTTSLSATPVKVEIPSSTVVTAPTGWDGTINVPQVKDNSTVTVTPDSGKTSSVNSVIEIGYGDVKLTFSKAVRVLIPEMAGKYAGYSRGGIFTPIPNICSADTQVAGDALASEGDCKIDVGSDLVIWTKHFTTFIAYTQTQNSMGRKTSRGSSVVNTNYGCSGGNLFNTVTGVRCLTIDQTTTTPVVNKIPITATLKLGSKGDSVKDLQVLLNSLGYDCGKADGVFGLKTKSAVIKFQISKKLIPDGKVGPLTRESLK